MQAYSTNGKAEDERREESPLVDMEMDLENERWAQSSKAEMSEFYVDESQDHTKKY